ncbi:transcriptional regulator, TetR family [Pseudooceanicola antarcticus]|uniref:TetR/AcrR family transcriptional regulator n=1 Tax=Pseudooceanicola antarcticus TaxID=1247613 RepID=A0A285HMI8_9RHOB|nr:TetR/AcrR family transcriptional regulator [Pseudooceanicola antarcticus]PJE27922.1 TetR/AcrR family transcriptional regulator [Pseudooceanicola antarcticus]SNY35901.1 transcriptional regulator, TetR family [Pseudooceanicola antarcticus]
MDTQTAPTRRGRKYDQVLEGARRVFLKDGFDNANVDEIAREAGVSKATLYSYFPDKRLLFFEIARSECSRQAEASQGVVVPDLPVEALLMGAARKIVGNLGSPMMISMFRVAAAEAGRFPELAKEFYANGPQLAQRMLTSYLCGAAERGDLDIANPEMAAAQFAELCKAGLMPKLLFGIIDHVPEAEAELVAREAVETFLARYGPKKES